MFLADLVFDAVQLLTLLIVVRAIFSWIPSVDYGHPAIRIIMRVTDPILEPIRRIMPPVGGFDLSPVIAIVLLQLVRVLLIRVLLSVF